MMTHTNDRREIVRRGKEIYENQLRPKLEAGNKGKILVIDIDTGEYELDDDHLAANQRARAKHPGARLFGMRIGFPGADKFGSWGSKTL